MIFFWPLYTTAGIQTHVIKVAPIQDLCKDWPIATAAILVTL